MFLSSLDIFIQQPLIRSLTLYVFLFFAYSLIGWILECLWVSFCKGKFENRGFLFGPICPIYGVGALICILLIGPLDLPWYLEFLFIILVCDFIEYFTSVFLEKIYHLRWWDYTDSSKFHLGGRISLETSIGFGLGGLIILNFLQPNILKFVSIFSPSVLFVFLIVVLFTFLFDLTLSSVAAASVKNVLKGGHVDLTNEIKKFSLNYYRKASRLSRKLARSTVKHMQNAQRQAQKTVNQAKETVSQAKKRVEETFRPKN